MFNIFTMNAALNLLQGIGKPLLSLGAQNNSVAVLQKCLASLGYDLAHSETSQGNFDGIYGSGTQTSVVDFQSDQKINPDGVAGNVTFTRIKEDLPTYRELLEKLKNINSEEFRKRFDLSGVPTPKGLPESFVWRPMGYVIAIMTQIDTLLGEGDVPKAVIEQIKYRVKIRPEKTSAFSSAQTSHGSINFTPSHYIPGEKLYLGKDFTIRASLLHEIFHAMRHTNKLGSSDNVVQTGRRRNLTEVSYPPGGREMGNEVKLNFKNRGELLAITVTNTYRSEINPVPIKHPYNKEMLFLRSDHEGFLKQNGLPRPDLFHLSPEIAPHLKTFRGEQPDLCKKIAVSKAPFNPIRELK